MILSVKNALIVTQFFSDQFEITEFRKTIARI